MMSNEFQEKYLCDITSQDTENTFQSSFSSFMKKVEEVQQEQKVLQILYENQQIDETDLNEYQGDPF